MFMEVQDSGEKKFNSSLAGGCWREKIQKISSPGPCSPSQNVEILTKM